MIVSTQKANKVLIIKHLAMKKYIILSMLAVCILLQNSLTAQRTITGTVKAADDGMPLPGVNVHVKGSRNIGTITDLNGYFSITVADTSSVLVFEFLGMNSEELNIGNNTQLNVSLSSSNVQIDEVVVTAYGIQKKSQQLGYSTKEYKNSGKIKIRGAASLNGKVAGVHISSPSGFRKIEKNKPLRDDNRGSESYATISENGFKTVKSSPLSTFSVDVDRASYSNVRRFINNGSKPPKDAVRIEEMINYFNYNYPEPADEHPMAVYTEISDCPWQTEHKLLHIGLQGKKIDSRKLPSSNLVFLIDVSGSMQDANKLPLLKEAFKLLVNNLRENDKVSIVVYAGAAGMVLEPTFGHNKQKIIEALEKLQAGGSTAGGAGITLAYQIAKENFIEKGNNRVILATDGDFNVGASSDNEMERLIEEKRKDGIFLTCLGFGMGNFKDSKMETLADKGNGNYAYVDNLDEAKKTLVSEFGSTLFTIAKDVKLQIEFNPAMVKAYRLIGYENRLLNDEDFNDDTKDAGEMGAGHSITALYEIIPAHKADDNTTKLNKTDELKYQTLSKTKIAENSLELATIKIRYKEPDKAGSIKFETVVKNEPRLIERCSGTYRFSAAVALFGMLLRESEFVKNADYQMVLELASCPGEEVQDSYQKEFISLVSRVNQ